MEDNKMTQTKEERTGEEILSSGVEYHLIGECGGRMIWYGLW